jgi:phenylacetic acid degradation operon negative regulatory protein
MTIRHKRPPDSATHPRYSTVTVLNVNEMSNFEEGDSWTPVRRAEHPPSARALLLTVLGEFVLPDGGTAWTATVVESLARLGVDEGAARQALARSSNRGLLNAERIGRRTRWALSDRGKRILTDGAQRIYSFGDRTAPWNGRWLLVMVTVPEHNRHLRARLRARMTWSGFGPLAPGVWISPWADREDDAVEILSELDLASSATSWVGGPGALGAIESRVAEIWSFERLAGDYQVFTAAATSDTPVDEPDSFAALVRLVHDWRHFPAADPGLPSPLLPAEWPAHTASRVFRARRAEWSPPAWAYWQSISDP